MKGYRFHPEAETDLDEIWEYIADNSHAADRVRDYLITYVPDEKPLWVIAVMHGYRDPRVMAAILRGRDQEPVIKLSSPRELVFIGMAG